MKINWLVRFKKFQSTPLIRGETVNSRLLCPARYYFNPLPSYEGRPDGCRIEPGAALISIHSPHTRGDVLGLRRGDIDLISIHSPLMRGETSATRFTSRMFRFQSTPLMRGETRDGVEPPKGKEFQSTPLMRGETGLHRPHGAAVSDFNPLPSREGRRELLGGGLAAHDISIHSPHARGDGLKNEQNQTM